MNKKTLDKKRIIYHAAVRTIARNGFYNTRIADIVKEANIAHGLFYHYFESKDAILIRIFKRSWQNLLTAMEKKFQESDDPIRKLEHVVDIIIHFYRQDPDLLKVLVMDVPRLPTFYEEDCQRLFNRFFTVMADVISEGVERGVIRSDVDPLIGAHILGGAVDSIIRQFVYNPEFGTSTIDFENVSNQIKQAILDGIKK